MVRKIKIYDGVYKKNKRYPTSFRPISEVTLLFWCNLFFFFFFLVATFENQINVYTILLAAY